MNFYHTCFSIFRCICMIESYISWHTLKMTSVQKINIALDKSIKYQRENSLWNHLLTVVRIDNDGLSGKVTQDGFKVWIYSHWVGIFHPVIYGTINSTKEKIKIQIESKMNPLGRLFSALILGFWTYGIVLGVVIQDDNSWTFLWKRILIGIVMISLPIVAFGLAFRYEYKKEKERIKNVCQQLL